MAKAAGRMRRLRATTGATFVGEHVAGGGDGLHDHAPVDRFDQIVELDGVIEPVPAAHAANSFRINAVKVIQKNFSEMPQYTLRTGPSLRSG
ncbi:MAG: hypothetical protein IJ089_11275 [Clostridia bacterium]|nr:hypothetical protein [Clostridia bacterium]